MIPLLDSLSTSSGRGLTPARVALLYAAFSVLWIVVSGALLNISVDDPVLQGRIEIGKGLLFVFVSSSLLFLLLKQWRDVPAALGSPLSAEHESPDHFRWLLLAFVVLAALVPLAGFFVIKIHGPQVERDAFANLQAIARLKAGQIENWLDERAMDGVVISSSPGFVEQVAALQREGASRVGNDVRARLNAATAALKYDAALLVDPEGKLLLGIGEPHPLPSPALLSSTKQQSVLFVDAEGKRHLDFIVPLLLPMNGKSQRQGMLILHKSPENFLFPYIQDWPTASATGETLLVRRDGDSALFLNKLRHHQGIDQSLRLPLSRSNFPAAIAVNATGPGRVEGVDYRGIAVLTAYQPVLGTDWVVVAKLDRDEVLEPLRNLAFWVALVALLALSAVCAGMLLYWRQRGRALRLEVQVQSDRLLQQFYELPFIGIGMRRAHADCWLQVNDRMCQIFGYSEEEMLSLPWQQFSHPDDISMTKAGLDRIARGEADGFELEKRFVRKDGSVLYASVDVRCVRKSDGSFDYVFSMIQDISERKADEARIHRLTQLYAALSECNQAIVRCGNQDELFSRICQVAVELGGMKMAWVGLINPETRRVEPVASFGEGDRWLDDVQISADAESPFGRGPTGIAICENRPVWIQDFQTDPATLPWNEQGAKAGWRAAAALPLKRNDQIVGVLMLFSGEADAFDVAERNLLTEVAQDVSFALTVFSREEARALAESRLQRLTQMYAALSECNQAIVRCDNEADLFPRICRFAVQFGGMMMAWVGLVDQETLRIHPVASYGDKTDHLADAEISADAGSPYGQGAVGQAIREGKPVWIQDYDNDHRTLSWRDRSKVAGWKACAALPLIRNGQVIGAFVMNAPQGNVFDEDMRNLMVEMAVDINFALDLFSRESERRHAESALRESEGRFRDLYEKAPLAYQSLDIEGNILEVNEAWLALLGRSRDEVIGRFIGDFLTDDSTQTLKNEFPRFQQKGRVDGPLFHFVRKDGEERVMMVNGTVVRDKGGHFLRTHCILTDLSERQEIEEKLKLAAKVFEQSAEGVIVTDPDLKILIVNRAFSAITGYSADEVIGKNPRMFSSGRHDEYFYQVMRDTVHAAGFWRGEVWSRRKNGEVYPELSSISQVLDEDGKVSHYVNIFSDISEHKAYEARIQRLAQYDPLTGLPNRSLLADRVSQAISRVQRNSQSLALIFLDLDRFKNVNDSLGHRIGDELLIQVAERLTSSLRDEDTVSRLGGDEFIMVLPDASAEGAGHVAEKLLKTLALPYQIRQHELTVTPSLGIAMYPTDGDTYEALSMRADAAMYRAKQSGRNTFRFFTREMQERSDRTLQLENALRRVLDLNQLQLHFQPQIDLATGRIIGVEALLRWPHPEMGMIPPSDFIPVAEDSGLILPIGEWVLRTAVRQMALWMCAGLDPMVMAINLSAVQFRQANLSELVSQILDEFKLPPRCLELELTEGVAMDNPLEAIAVMNDLHEHGIRMSIDDFGTGYSSLSYLRRFKVSRLKIDQSFVRDISNNPEDVAIVEAIIGLSRSLGLKTIAEGVETAEQLAFLRGRGCDEVQGYYFAKPMPAGAFEAFMRNYRAL